jgi:hypothetical protein
MSKQIVPSIPNACRIAVVLGAGASRGVSYRNDADIQSPLDSDFFDLLQRVDAGPNDRPAIQSVLSEVQKLSYEHWRSMEKSFYTIHLRAYLKDKLTGDNIHHDQHVIKNFARCVQALLRKAHDINTCTFHKRLFMPLHKLDMILTFNYDLVSERALRPIAEVRQIPFGPWIYSLDPGCRSYDVPPIFKLHGSSDWKLIVPAKSEKLKKPEIMVRIKSWMELDESPGYLGHRGTGSVFPIFLPFWDKRIEEEPWLPLWKQAFERLQKTDILIIWGYSLPTTDIKAKHFFGLSLSDKAIKLCVIDPSDETQRKWRELMPKAHFFHYDSIEKFYDAPPKWWKDYEKIRTYVLENRSNPP